MPPSPRRARRECGEEKDFRLRSEVIAELGPEALDERTVGTEVVIRDSLVPLYREKRLGKILLRYGVTATRDKKRVSEMSPLVAILPAVPPGRPLDLVATVLESRVCLEWLAPDAMLDESTPVRVGAYAAYRKSRSGRVVRGADRRRREGDVVHRRDRPLRPAVPLHGPRGPHAGEAAPPRAAGGRDLADTRDVFPPAARPGSSSWSRRRSAPRMDPGPLRRPRVVSRLPAGSERRGLDADRRGAEGDLGYFDPGRRRRAPGTASTAVDRPGNESPVAEESR